MNLLLIMKIVTTGNMMIYYGIINIFMNLFNLPIEMIKVKNILLQDIVKVILNMMNKCFNVSCNELITDELNFFIFL